MKASQADDGDGEKDDEGHQDQGHDALRFVQSLFVAEHVEHTPGEHGDHVNTEEHEKEKEMPVVPPANTVVHPWTVMIERFCVTKGSGWSVICQSVGLNSLKKSKTLPIQ